MSYRTLGTNVIPSNYKVKIETDMERFTFKCNVKIFAKISKHTNEIKLNSKNLKISSVSITSENDSQKCKISHDKKNEEITLSFPRKIKGDVVIEIESLGVNEENMRGFYKSTYTHKGKEDHILTTQLEPADCRNIFPCFDEPSFKATFDVTLVVDKNLTAISNMPINGEKTTGIRKEVKFKTSPKMSTYLLYLGVGKFEYLEKSYRNIKLRVYCTPGKKSLLKIALDDLSKFLRYYENYFGIKYPLPKLDMIAIPDFAAGAMENWGAITFRETEMLGDKNTPISIRQRIAEVIAHELAHQWFGNLVTMKWWDDTWLNESFAEYMAFKAMHSVYPKWDTMKRYVDDTVAYAFVADSLNTTIPIGINIPSVHEIDQAFDPGIGYRKGGSVLYMLENYVGSEIFRKGINDYLKKNAYQNTIRDQLWNSIQRKTKKEVSSLMKGWISKKGHPIVYVEKTKDGFKLTQKRATVKGDKDDQAWMIPITYLHSRGKNSVLMKSKTMKIKTKSKWIKLNYGETGFYRTKYEDNNLEMLGEMLRDKKLNSLDGWGIEKDLFFLARRGDIPLTDYLEFVRTYCIGCGFPMNSSISASLSWFKSMTRDKLVEENVNSAIQMFHGRLFAKLGWKKRKTESTIDTQLRSAAISMIGEIGDKDVIKKCENLFAKLINNKGNVDPDLRGVIYSIAAKHGDSKTFNKVIEKYKKETRPDEKRRLLAIIGAFEKEMLVNKAFEFNKSTSVKIQDGYVIPMVASRNPYGRSLIWTWTKSNWKDLMRTYPNGTKMLKVFVDMNSFHSDKEFLEDFKRFFYIKSNQRGDIDKGIRNTRERVETNIKFMKKNRL